MVLWQEEAYTRKDENGQPISFVSTLPQRPTHADLLSAYQEEYKRRKPNNRRFQFMTQSDLQLYSVTGYSLQALSESSSQLIYQ